MKLKTLAIGFLSAIIMVGSLSGCSSRHHHDSHRGHGNSHGKQMHSQDKRPGSGDSSKGYSHMGNKKPSSNQGPSGGHRPNGRR
ncbi:Uncharacterised protein [Leminorella richardii]|uniref:Lipoprotein n=1 Tax=Leminorella richardii TaxID=158841 RepID=A0A2X4USI1_9GAMM|nr:hypothetical protein [Leminorella richardii]SQI42826.1 Uncharacterised protein [Leminorella richardii]